MSSARRGIGSAKPRSNQKDSIKFDEVIGLFEFSKHPNEHVRVRLLEKGLIVVKRHWCKIVAGNTKKEVQIPRFCVKFNPMDENSPHDVECPYCALVTKDRETSQVTNEFFYLTNAIIRDLQEDEPSKKADHTKDEKKTGYKDIRSKSWTPVRVLRLTSSMVGRIQEIGEQNTKTDQKSGKKKSYDVSHPKNGIDLNIKFKPKASGTDKYSIDAVGKRTPLTEEEDGYLVWNLTEELLDLCGRMDPKQAKEDFKRMEFVGGEEIPDDDDDDDDIPVGKKKKGKKAFGDDDDEPKKKKKKKPRDDDDEDEDDEDDEPKSKKSKKSKAGVTAKSSKKKSSRDDDDDEEDDEEPKKKKKKSKDKKVDKTKKKKSKPSRDDDDDDDDEDEKPSKKKKSKDKEKSSKKDKKKSKSKSKIDDDDDWD